MNFDEAEGDAVVEIIDSGSVLLDTLPNVSAIDWIQNCSVNGPGTLATDISGREISDVDNDSIVKIEPIFASTLAADNAEARLGSLIDWNQRLSDEQYTSAAIALEPLTTSER